MIELKTSRKSTDQNGPSLRNGNRSPTTRGFLDKTKSTLEKKLKRASWSPDKSPILDLGLEIANFGIKKIYKQFRPEKFSDFSLKNLDFESKNF